MKTIVLSYDRDTRTLSASDTDAGSVVDNGVTTLHVDRIPGCTMDLVYGLVLRSGTSLVGSPYSRLDDDGDAILYSNVLRACTGGALPVTLRLTYDDNTVEHSKSCILKVRFAPEADIKSTVEYSDLAMTRNSSMSWVDRWRYNKGAVAVHNGALWLALSQTKGEEPKKGSDKWVQVGGTESEDIGVLMGIRGNVQDQLDGKNSRIYAFDMMAAAGMWTRRADGSWAQTIYHVGLHVGHEIRVTWARESYLGCWISNVRIESIEDGSATLVADSKPDENLRITVTGWEL